jgi:two-component system response regulator DevR
MPGSTAFTSRNGATNDLLTRATDIDVVGDSGSAQGVVAEILRLDADVMLLDLQLQDGTGIEVCRAVRSVKPSVTGLLLTASGDDEALSAAVLAGAAGYLVKESRSSDIIGAIRNQRPGTSQLDALGLQRAAGQLRSVMESLRPPLPEDERQILEHILAGQTDREIIDAGQRDADVVAFVARMTQSLLGRGTPSVAPGTGRHRRDPPG